MCDICGFIAPTAVDASAILAMSRLGKHRGPDDEGYLLVRAPGAAPASLGGADTLREAFESSTPYAPAGRIDDRRHEATMAWGFRRLSILDLSVLGRQPMSTPDKRFWLIYNGEIYNYAGLAGELSALGYQFRSRSDSEVLLAAYAQWGADCLSRLNGMFAFAIYDAAAGETFLARDRFGIKPLYYWFSPDGTFYFASEIKQFTAAPGWRATLNLSRAAEFLANSQTDDGDETMFAGVFHLLPGHCATVPITGATPDATGRLRTRQWYELKATPFSGSFEDAAAEYHRLLSDAVRLMLRADVPVGSCLSGGLDSSSIVCLINRDLRLQDADDLQRTFSARSDVAAFDESQWIEEVVTSTQVDAKFVTPSPEQLQMDADLLAWHQDEPVASTSYFAEWCVYKLVAGTGVKVMLDGQGADEALAGYHGYLAPYLAGLVRSGRFGEAWRETRAIMQRHGYGGVGAIRSIAEALLLSDREGATVTAMSYAQLTHSNLQMMLRSADRSSMAHSVESRVPFVDHRVIEFALGLPDAFKIGGGVTKRVLREAMSGVLPDRVRDRVDKIAFETPESQWMMGERRGWFRGQLEQAVETSNSLVPVAALTRFDTMVAGAGPFHREAWRAISFGQWMRVFGVAAPARGDLPQS